MTGTRKTPPVRDAWPQLRALAAGMRADWEPGDTDAAILAWELANLPFGDAEREVHRVIWDTEGSPAEIRNTARARARHQVPSGSGVSLEERQELLARALASCEAATEAQHREAS